MKIVLFISLLLIWGCASKGNQEKVSMVEYLGDGIVKFESEINSDSVNKFFEIANEYQISHIVVNSPGGDVSSAIDMAEMIFRDDISIEVNDICASSCANYFLPAAKITYLRRDSLLAWHGSAFQNDFINSKRFTEQYRDLQRKEYSFYQEIGVNPMLGTMGQNAKIKRSVGARFYQGFFEYPMATLEFLGLSNIVLRDEIWDWRNNREITARMKGIYMVEVNSVGDDYCIAVAEYVEKLGLVFADNHNYLFGFEEGC